MGPVDFTGLSIGTNLLIFGGAAVFVWIAGTRLAHYVDQVGERTGLGQAFLGVALLGVATSLPEIATTLTGALIGNASLVMGNLFGGIAMQVALLAIVDMVVVRGALTYVAPQPILLFQGVMLLLLLSVAVAGAALSDPLSILGVGATSVLVVVLYVVTVSATSGKEYLPRWRPTHLDPNEPRGNDGKANGSDRHDSSESPSPPPRGSATALYTRCGVAGLTILVAGWVLASTGDALATQTGLGSTFVGVVLVAISTSLPELSTTLTAAKAGNYEMAVSNILGTNCLSVALLLPADLAFRGGPILATTDRATLLAIAMGMVVTTVLLLGLLERRDRTVGGMGLDSLAILVLYGAGLVGVYSLS